MASSMPVFPVSRWTGRVSGEGERSTFELELSRHPLGHTLVAKHRHGPRGGRWPASSAGALVARVSVTYTQGTSLES